MLSENLALLPALDAFLEATTAAQKWRALRPIENTLKRRISAAFVRQGATLATRRASGMEWLTVFDAVAKTTLPFFIDPIQEAASAAMLAGAKSLISELAVDIAFNLKNPRAVSYLDAHGAKLVTAINDTTRDSLRVLVRQGVDEGWSYAKTAKAIREQFDGFAGKMPQAHIRDRATLVAVTESAMAYEEGNRIVVDDLADAGLVMQHQWLSVGDAKVTPKCRANQAQGWIALEDDFDSGHSNAPRFPGCRCTTLYRRKPS